MDKGLWEKAKQRGEGRLFIYLLFMFLCLIEFPAIVPARGYKSCLSIGQDSQKTSRATDVREGQAGGKRRPRFMCARKNMTSGLCWLSAEHLFHYLEDS